MNVTPITIPSPEQMVPWWPPPVMEVQQHASVNPSHVSMGPTIVVVSIIALLGIISALLGRLCGGRAVMGYGGEYNMQQWVETKCASCVDGYVGPPPPRVVDPDIESGGGGGTGNGTVLEPPMPPVMGIPMLNTGEIKTEEEEDDDEDGIERSEGEEELGNHQNHENLNSQNQS